MHDYAKVIGQKAKEALIEEALTTPKPGLVDCFSNGAHDDMDLDMFLRSAAVLEAYFVRMAQLGMRYPRQPQRVFRLIRQVGLEAEQAMYQTTGGVNTYKGAVFTMGILAAAAGALMERDAVITEQGWIALEQEMVRDILHKELECLSETEEMFEGESDRTKTHGEENLVRYGSLGVRGEAMLGYPAVVELALPVLRAGKKDGRDWNLVKLQALFTLMAQVEDGNVLSRAGEEGLRDVRQIAGEFLSCGGAYQTDAVKQLERLDQIFIQKKYSNGGCADLLAAAVFMDSLMG